MLKQQKLLSHISRDQRSEIKVSAGLALFEGCGEELVPGLSPWLVGGGLLPVSSHYFPMDVLVSKFPLL